MRNNKRPILTVFFASLTFIFTLLVGILSDDNLKASVFGNPEPPVLVAGIVLDEHPMLEKDGLWSFCLYQMPEAPEYSVELESVKVQEDIQSGDVFQVDVSFKNIGNTRLFSQNSQCPGLPIMNLGTQNVQDRESTLGSSTYGLSGWYGAGRVKMLEDYADPDGVFHVQFQSIAPDGDNIYREFFQPVVENVAWIGETFGIDIPVGTPTESMKTNISFVSDISIAASALEGLERSLEIDLTSQYMYARFGEIRVWSMRVSSGHWETPTPRGDYQILSKQELRIGGKSPHYRMPYFQMWRWDGYGIHALPYLASDGGAFWSEALDHIGRPVSHGCVRTLPDDALLLYQFTDIGTPINIH